MVLISHLQTILVGELRKTFMWQENQIPDSKYEQLNKRILQLETKLELIINQNEEPAFKEKYVDIVGACSFLGISRIGLYRLMKSGKIGFTYIGKQRRLLVSEMVSYAERNKVNALPSIL